MLIDFPAPSEHTFADASGQAFDTQGYAGPLPNNPGDVVMTRLQIAMQREVAGWPLYTIVIALGQVRIIYSSDLLLLTPSIDAGCNKFPNNPAERAKLGEQLATLCIGWSLLGSIYSVVYPVPLETLRLRIILPLAFLRIGLLPYRPSVCHRSPGPRP